MDRWFKRTFGWKPAKPLMMLFLKELIPERDIVDLNFGPQEHVNPVESGKDVRMDIDCTDRDVSRMERRPEGLEGEIFDLLFNSVEISKYSYGFSK